MQKVCAHYVHTYLKLTENWIYNLVKNFTRFTPLILARKSTNVDKFPINQIITLSDLNYIQYFYNFIILKTKNYFPVFLQYCKIKNVKILHVHFGNQGIKLFELKRQLKIPMICNFYGFDAFRIPDDRDYYKNLNTMFRKVDKIFVLGPYMKKRIIDLNCPEQKIHIQHLGVDLNKIKFKPRQLPEDYKYQFLIASSFVQKKGIDDAIIALNMIKKDLNFTLHIIGDGYLKYDILKLIDTLDLNNRIILHGYQPYPIFLKLAYECHAFLQASKTADNHDKEGTPMAIVDAMATGLPVVSTYHSDIPEIVISEKTGFLSIENEPKSFSEAILKLVDNNKIYSELSKTSRLHIEKEFNAKIQALKVEKIYDNLINHYK